MPDIFDVSRNLMAIASKAGNPFALDGAEEKRAAEAYLSAEMKALELSDADCCTMKMAKRALDAIRKSDDGAPLFVNPLFGDDPDIFCWFLCIGRPLVDILEPLPAGHLVSFKVYSGGSMWWGNVVAKVGVTGTEWDYITAPLVAVRSRYAKADPADGAVAADKANDFMDALGAALGRFEEVVGRKAGTDRDVGGFAGNMKLERGEEEGQQDCINEFLTARQAIALFSTAGLMNGWKFNWSDHEFQIGPTFQGGGVIHKAIKISDEYGTIYAVDTWLEDNGRPAVVLPVGIYEEYFRKRSWRDLYPPFMGLPPRDEEEGF